MTHLTSISLEPERFPQTDVYPFSLPLFQSGRETESMTMELETPVTYFIGENGSGKSTLLRAIANRCNIYIWKGIERSRYTSNRYRNALCNYLSIQWSNSMVPGSYFDSEVFNNFAQILDDWAANDPGVLSYFGGESLLNQSHGQCNMSFFRNRFNRPGLYLLDEPETALSPKYQIEFLNLLQETTKNGTAQFIICTHSPILLSHPESKIFDFSKLPLGTTTYEDTELFTVYRDFLNTRGVK